MRHDTARKHGGRLPDYRLAGTRKRLITLCFIEARQSLGKAAMEIKDWETAAAQFRGVIAWEPGDASAHHQLSLALKALGQTEDAEIELRAAQQLNPSIKTP